MSEYDNVSRSSLRLKCSDDRVSKRKRKSKKDKSKSESKWKKMMDKSAVSESKACDQTVSSTTNADNESSTVADAVWMTSAERKFMSQQEKRQLCRVMEKASKSHKQRVEEFNTHLENLTEHYDIPKVSWTK